MGRPRLSARVKYERACAVIDEAYKPKFTIRRLHRAMQTSFTDDNSSYPRTFNVGAYCLRSLPQTITALLGDTLIDFLNESAVLPGVGGAIYQQEYLATLDLAQCEAFVLGNIRRGVLPDADFARQLVPLVGRDTFGKWLLTVLGELPNERASAPDGDFINRFLSFGAEGPPEAEQPAAAGYDHVPWNGWWSQMDPEDVEAGVLLCLEKDPHSLFAYGQAWACNALRGALGKERFMKILKLAASSTENLNQVDYEVLVAVLPSATLYKLLDRLKHQVTVERFWQAMLVIARLQLPAVEKFVTLHQTVLQSCEPWELAGSATIDLPGYNGSQNGIRRAKQIMLRGMIGRGFVFAKVEEVISVKNEELALITCEEHCLAVEYGYPAKGDIVVFDPLQEKQRSLIRGSQSLPVYVAECFEYAPKLSKDLAPRRQEP